MIWHIYLRLSFIIFCPQLLLFREIISTSNDLSAVDYLHTTIYGAVRPQTNKVKGIPCAVSEEMFLL